VIPSRDDINAAASLTRSGLAAMRAASDALKAELIFARWLRDNYPEEAP